MPHAMIQGYQAALKGTPLIGNPYAFTLCGSEAKANQWELGFLQAKAELSKRKTKQ